MPTKRRRGDTWHFVVKRAGLLDRPFYVSFPVDREREGDEYCARLEALLDRGIVPDELRAGPRKSDRLRDHVRRYLADQHVAVMDRDCLRIAVYRLPADLDLPALTFAWAQDWVTRMKRVDNLAPSTLRHHVGALARCFDWLAAHGSLAFNPLRLLPRGYSTYTQADVAAVGSVAGVPKGNTERDRRLQVGEEARIRSVLGGDVRDAAALLLLFDLALESAMRMREIFTLDWTQIDLPARTVFLDKTKNGDRRQVPLSSVALARLQPIAAAAGRLFPWWDGEAATLAKVTARLSQRFARVFRDAGCADLNFHDLRHEATSRLFERTTLSDVQIAKITGHRSTRMLMRYANLRASDLAERMW